MLRSIYMGLSAIMLTSYIGWNVMGLESGSNRRDPVPKTPTAKSRARGGAVYYGRSRSSYYGSSSSGWGK